MSPRSEKLRLGGNHRRVVSVLLRNVEKAAEGIAGWLERKPGLFTRYRDDFSAAEQLQLRKMAAQLHSEVQQFYDEVDLDCTHQSRRRALAALISSATIDLEEVNSHSLRGYGEVPPEVGRELDAKLERLRHTLERISAMLEAE